MAETDSVLVRRLLASRLIGKQQLEQSRVLLGESADDDRLFRFLVEQGHLTAWQSAKVQAGRSDGFFLGKYKILEQLGAGGMGKVYRALDTGLARDVAVKILPKKKADAESIARFRREAEIAMKLRHPNIIRTVETGVEDDVYYLVMQYVDGLDLASRLKEQGVLPVRDAARIGADVARGLQYACDQGVIHRDIKPSNILLSRNGEALIADFGLVKQLNERDTKQDMTKTGSLMGTFDYLSPEQAEDAKRADTRSDIYSLGCTLYHCLTGQPPFDGTEVQKIVAHREKRPTPICSLNASVPGELAELIETRMLAKRRRDRFQTSSEVEAALMPFITDRSASPPRGIPVVDGQRQTVARDETAIPDRMPLHDQKEPPPAKRRAATNRSGVSVFRLEESEPSPDGIASRTLGRKTPGGRHITPEQASRRPLPIRLFVLTGLLCAALIAVAVSPFQIERAPLSTQHLQPTPISEARRQPKSAKSNRQESPSGPVEIVDTSAVTGPSEQLADLERAPPQERDANQYKLVVQHQNATGTIDLAARRFETVPWKANPNGQVSYPRWFDADRLVYLEDYTKLVSVQADGTGRKELHTFDQPTRFVAFSHDRKHVVSAVDLGQNMMRLIDVKFDSKTVSPLTPEMRWVSDPDWSPKGDRLAYTYFDSPDYVLVIQEGERRTDLVRGLRGWVYPAWSPDGKLIAYGTSSDKDVVELALTTVDGSQRRQLTRSGRISSYAAWSSDGRYLAFVEHDKSTSGTLMIWDTTTDKFEKLLDNVALDRPSWRPLPNVTKVLDLRPTSDAERRPPNVGSAIEKDAKAVPSATAVGQHKAGNEVHVTTLMPAAPTTLKCGERVRVGVRFSTTANSAVVIRAYPYARGRLIQSYVYKPAGDLKPGIGDAVVEVTSSKPAIATEFRVELTVFDGKNNILLTSISHPAQIEWK